ncbi:MAG: hypothetical protein KC636_20805, partial [Myxococcales bacterium]|nr:hypothetical protein [Myxococcales bacterium]
MASATPRARRSLAHDPRLAWALAALFFTVGVALIRTDRFLHDEGLLSWFFAGILADEPIATLFFLKARPPLALLYAPISGLGLDVFLWLHVLVAALAIPLMAAVARALGQGAPNLVALALAAPPMMLAAAPSGVGNTDAITGLALALYLLVARRSPAAAGLVAGALPLVRAEITIYVLALALYCLPRARRRFLYALPAVGLALALAGALYHQDVLWFIHYPPTLTSPGQDTPAFGEHGYAQASLGQTAGALLSIAPLLGLLALLPWRALHPLERALLLAGLAFGLAIRGLPFTGLFHFDDSPRYALPLIMMMAPLGRLATTEAEGRGWPAAALYVALLVVGDAIDRAEGSRLLLAAIAGGV